MRKKITRWQHRGQSGFSTFGALTGVATSATLAGLMLMNSGEQVEAAESTVCTYEKTVLMTAVEAFNASSTDFDYPTPAGVDGLDEVRDAGWLRKESRYWRYTGVDANNTPQYLLISGTPNCE